MDDLLNKKCVPCEGGVKPLTHDEIQSNLKKTPGLTDDVAASNMIYNKKLWI